MLALWISLLCSLPVQDPARDEEPVAYLGHPGALRIVGAEAVPAEAVLEALTEDPDFFEASHPLSSRSAYGSWLKEVLTDAYQHAGFADVVVEVHFDSDGQVVEIEVEEGARLVAGEVRFENVSALDPGWVRAVLEAGSVQAAAWEGLPVPPGPNLQLPSARRVSGAEQRSLWKPGAAARCSARDRARFENLVFEAARAAGLRTVDLEVRWERGERDELLPTVLVVVEGPLDTVREVRLEGEFQDPVEVLLGWVGIPPGTTATALVPLVATERLRSSGRFGVVSARYDATRGPGAQQDLIITLEQAPEVPALEDHPADELALLRRALQGLAEGGTSRLGVDIEVTASAEQSDSLVARLRSSRLPMDWNIGDHLAFRFVLLQEYSTLELTRISAAEAATPLLRLAYDESGGFAQCPPLGVSFDLPAAAVVVQFLLKFDYRKGGGISGQDLAFNASFAVRSRREGDGSPLRLINEVSPSALLRLLEISQEAQGLGPERFVRTASFDGSSLKYSVDRAQARLLAELELDRDGLEGRIRFGDLDEIQPPAWAALLATGADGAGGQAGPGVPDLVRWLQSQAELGADWITPEGTLAMVGVYALAVEGLRASDRKESEHADRFRTTTASDSAEEDVLRTLAESFAGAVIRRGEPGEWPAELARALPLLVAPASREELTWAMWNLKWATEADDIGPVGYLLAAKICELTGETQVVSAIARYGLRDLSAEAFLEDCDSLFRLGPNSLLSPVARAWRGLCIGEDEGGAERELLRGILADLTPEDPPETWLRAGLERLWEVRLRGLVERELVALKGEVRER